MRLAAKSGSSAEKGPAARRRPKTAREAYFLYVECAVEGANEADGPLSALELAEEIDLRKVDDLVAAAAQDRPQHEQAESRHLLERDCRRHRQLLARDQHLDERRAIVGEG